MKDDFGVEDYSKTLRAGSYLRKGEGQGPGVRDSVSPRSSGGTGLMEALR